MAAQSIMTILHYLLSELLYVSISVELNNTEITFCWCDIVKSINFFSVDWLILSRFVGVLKFDKKQD